MSVSTTNNNPFLAPNRLQSNSEPQAPAIKRAQPEVIIADRNQTLNQTSYQQAYNDLHEELLPIIEQFKSLYGEPEKNSDAFSFRPVIEAQIPDLEKFDSVLDKLFSNIQNKSFTFQDIKRLNLLVKALKKNDTTNPESREGQHFKQSLAYFEKLIDQKVLNSPDQPVQFVVNLLKGLNTIEKLEGTLSMVQRAPVNKNHDLKQLSNQLVDSVRNIQLTSGNILAYAQGDRFDKSVFKEYVQALPEQMEAFEDLLMTVNEHPAVQNNPEYAQIVGDLIKQTLNMMNFFAPDLEKVMIEEMQQQNAQPSLPTMQPSISLPSASFEINKNLEQKPMAPSMPAVSEPQSLNQQNADYVAQKADNVKNLLQDQTHTNNINPQQLQNGKQIDALQDLWQKAYQAKHMKNQINAVNEIGQNMEEMALAGAGKPNPEMIALSKRGKRLNSLQSLMNEVPKINKATQELEKAALDSQHAHMTGINQIATQRLNNDIEAAHMQADHQKTYAKGLEKLTTDGLELSTEMAKNRNKRLNLTNQILDMKISNTWDRLKTLARGFKW